MAMNILKNRTFAGFSKGLGGIAQKAALGLLNIA
jgi:hypothetical protein